MFEVPRTLQSRLMAPGILRAPELIHLLEAIVEAYRCEVPRVRSVVLFGGITLGEYHPGFSDVDLAIVFEGEAPVLESRLPKAVRVAIHKAGFCQEIAVRAKHVGSNVLNTMQDQDWQTWATWSAGNLSTESSYPFTLCDTWLVHNRGLTLAGCCVRDSFPFADAPPTHRDVELARLKCYTQHLPFLFSAFSGMELAREVIYYGTDFTRAIYTLRTGDVIGRVAGTRWYRSVFRDTSGEYAQLMGEFRRHPERIDLSQISDTAALWRLFQHYAREVLCFALPGVPLPRSLPRQDEFASWLEAWITSASNGPARRPVSGSPLPRCSV